MLDPKEAIACAVSQAVKWMVIIEITAFFVGAAVGFFIAHCFQ